LFALELAHTYLPKLSEKYPGTFFKNYYLGQFVHQGAVKNATQKLPQIVLEESIGVGMLMSIGYYITYIVSGQNQHTYSYTFFQDNLRQLLRCIFGQSSFSIQFNPD